MSLATQIVSLATRVATEIKAVRTEFAAGLARKLGTSDTAPSSPVVGDAWFDSSRGRTFVYYNDGDSSQWIEIGSAQAGALRVNPLQPTWRSSYWVTSPATLAVSTVVPLINFAGYSPFYVPSTTTFKTIGLDCQVGQAGTTIRLGIYNADEYFTPTTLALDAGVVDTSVSGLKSITISVTLSEGYYCLAHVSQGGTIQPTVRHSTTPLIALPMSVMPQAQSSQSMFTQSGVTGVLPATATGTQTGLLTITGYGVVKVQVN